MDLGLKPSSLLSLFFLDTTICAFVLGGYTSILTPIAHAATPNHECESICKSSQDGKSKSCKPNLTQAKKQAENLVDAAMSRCDNNGFFFSQLSCKSKLQIAKTQGIPKIFAEGSGASDTVSKCTMNLTMFAEGLGDTAVQALSNKFSDQDTLTLPTASELNSIAYPNPNLNFMGASHLKMADGTPAPGNTSEEKLRAFMAESFERLVRIYIGGTEQLKIDFPKTYKGPEILGLYQGHRPNILHSTNDTIYQGAYLREWKTCPSTRDLQLGKWDGIANQKNGDAKWFKSQDGSYTNETITERNGAYYLKSHGCAETQIYGCPRAALGRGQVIHQLMTLMQKMQNDLKNGKVVHASSYSTIRGPAPDSCATSRSMIIALRAQNQKLYQDILNGLSGTGISELSCDPTGDGLSKPSTGSEQRACFVASGQTRIEITLMINYLFCTWESVSDQVYQAEIEKLNSLCPMAKLENQQNSKQPIILASMMPLSLFLSLSILLRGGRRLKLVRKSIIIILLVTITTLVGGCAKKEGSCGTGYRDGDIFPFNYTLYAFQPTKRMAEEKRITKERLANEGDMQQVQQVYHLDDSGLPKPIEYLRLGTVLVNNEGEIQYWEEPDELKQDFLFPREQFTYCSNKYREKPLGESELNESCKKSPRIPRLSKNKKEILEKEGLREETRVYYINEKGLPQVVNSFSAKSLNIQSLKDLEELGKFGGITQGLLKDLNNYRVIEKAISTPNGKTNESISYGSTFVKNGEIQYFQAADGSWRNRNNQPQIPPALRQKQLNNAEWADGIVALRKCRSDGRYYPLDMPDREHYLQIRGKCEGKDFTTVVDRGFEITPSIQAVKQGLGEFVPLCEYYADKSGLLQPLTDMMNRNSEASKDLDKMLQNIQSYQSLAEQKKIDERESIQTELKARFDLYKSLQSQLLKPCHEKAFEYFEENNWGENIWSWINWFGGSRAARWSLERAREECNKSIIVGIPLPNDLIDKNPKEYITTRLSEPSTANALATIAPDDNITIDMNPSAKSTIKTAPPPEVKGTLPLANAPFSNSSAATGGDVIDKPKAAGPGFANTPERQQTNGTGPLGRFAPGNPGAGGADTANSALGGSTVSTPPAESDNAASTTALQASNEAAGGYAGSGGGAAAGSGGGAGGSDNSIDFGFGSNGATGGGNSMVDYGGGISGEGMEAMASEDPSDYFARTELADDLFKKVERRYAEKARAWTLEGIRAPASKQLPPKLPKTQGKY